MKIELSHDILAKKIYDMASAEDKMHVKIRNFVNSRYVYYKDAQVFLDQTALDYIAPYIYKINLEQEELDFIEKSKRKLTIKQYAFRFSVVVVFFILLVSGIQAAFTFRDLYFRAKGTKERLDAIESKQEERAKAELRAQQLLAQTAGLSQKDLKDSNVVKQLIIQYDTLSKQQDDIRKQRDLARSATLSDLANAAVEQDKNYAFQLAAKSWELNKKNKQALEVLEKLSNEKKSFVNLPENEIQEIIQDNKVGDLKEKDLKAIFSSENTVVQRTHAGTKVKDQVKICTKKIKDNPLEQNTDNPSFVKIIQQHLDIPIKNPIKKVNTHDNHIVTNNKTINENIKKFNPSVMVGDLECIKVKHLVGQWITMQDSHRKTFYCSYSNDGVLSFQFSDNQNYEFYELVFYAQNQEKQIVKLKIETNILGKINYIVEMTDEVEALIQKEAISNLTFVSKNKSNTKKASLTKEAQAQFLNLSKCLL